ncbi:MAG: excinuclease ABC subunit C, partial [Chloroflexi bacterium]|nr:excinuclease ABC subunit C [Chloroflexota bacterium]
SESVMLPRNSQALYLIQRVRDEAHRFGLTYHRQLRGKTAVHSGLDEIEGIGPKRRKALLKKFGSLEAIRQASIAELLTVPGMTRSVAEKLKEDL